MPGGIVRRAAPPSVPRSRRVKGAADPAAFGEEKADVAPATLASVEARDETSARQFDTDDPSCDTYKVP